MNLRLSEWETIKLGKLVKLLDPDCEVAAVVAADAPAATRRYSLSIVAGPVGFLCNSEDEVVQVLLDGGFTIREMRKTGFL